MPAESADLEVRSLTVRFGGATAVDDVSLVARGGEITGLIGPNGAGKTTTFNACSGLLTPDEGSVHLAGVDITDDPPQARARQGLGRTFQRMELVGAQSVRWNIALGPHARLAGSSPLRQAVCRGTDRRRIDDAVQDAVEACGLTDLASRPVGSLSTGQRRLVELARVWAAGFRLLLLDEPSSGLDHLETERFGDILRTLVRDTGAGVLLVEHDMDLVMSTCETLHVLDFGSLIFSGDADEAQRSAVVRSAYLGSVA